MNLHTGINQKTHLFSEYLILITVFFFLYVNVGKTANLENHTAKTSQLNNFEYPGDTFLGIYNGSLSKLDYISYGNGAFQVINDHRAKPISFLEISKQYSFYKSAGESGEGNAATAFFIAFVPGFFVHGLGHNYIGDKKTFKILLITEAISLPIIFYSAIASSADQLEGGKDIPLADAALVVSISAFMISWIYDFIGAPIRAEYSVINPKSDNIYTLDPKNKYAQFSAKIVCSF